MGPEAYAGEQGTLQIEFTSTLKKMKDFFFRKNDVARNIQEYVVAKVIEHVDRNDRYLRRMFELLKELHQRCEKPSLMINNCPKCDYPCFYDCFDLDPSGCQPCWECDTLYCDKCKCDVDGLIWVHYPATSKVVCPPNDSCLICNNTDGEDSGYMCKPCFSKNKPKEDA